MSEVNAVVLHADGNAEIKYVEATAEAYHDIVAGWIQGIWPSTDRGFGDWIAYVNEDGKPMGLPRNPVADEILTNIGWNGVAWGDFVVGTVVIVGTLPSGADTNVPDVVLQHVLAYFREHGAVENT